MPVVQEAGDVTQIATTIQNVYSVAGSVHESQYLLPTRPHPPRRTPHHLPRRLRRPPSPLPGRRLRPHPPRRWPDRVCRPWPPLPVARGVGAILGWRGWLSALAKGSQPMTRLHVLGFPAHVGGAGTELWHTLRLWRQHGAQVTITPTWRLDEEWAAKCDAGCADVQT